MKLEKKQYTHLNFHEIVHNTKEEHHVQGPLIIKQRGGNKSILCKLDTDTHTPHPIFFMAATEGVACHALLTIYYKIFTGQIQIYYSVIVNDWWT